MVITNNSNNIPHTTTHHETTPRHPTRSFREINGWYATHYVFCSTFHFLDETKQPKKEKKKTNTKKTLRNYFGHNDGHLRPILNFSSATNGPFQLLTLSLDLANPGTDSNFAREVFCCVCCSCLSFVSFVSFLPARFHTVFSMCR